MIKTAYIEEINDIRNKSLHFFASANTENGFVSNFDSIFNNDEIKKLYILKGGPGVGKSTFMKKVAITAERKGLTAVCYHCSSDPKSLDGVFVKEKGLAIIDGTAPHVFDPVYPGARDIIINLGEAWDLKKLEKNTSKIKELSAKKSACYKTAYRLLGAAKSFEREKSDIGRICLDEHKMHQAALRLAEKCGTKSRQNKKSDCEYFLNNAVSCDGKVRFFTYEKLADTLYFVKNSKNMSGYFFKTLLSHLTHSGEKICVGRDALNPENITDIYLPSCKTCISMYDEDFCMALERNAVQYKVINMARFIDAAVYKQHKAKYRFAEKCFDTLTDEAFSYFAKAAAFHAELEKIYGTCTDYEKVAQLTEIKI